MKLALIELQDEEAVSVDKDIGPRAGEPVRGPIDNKIELSLLQGWLQRLNEHAQSHDDCSPLND